MGPYLDIPVTEKESEDGSNRDLVYGACSMQGWRKAQEDSYVAHLDMQNDV